jgi:O-antigen ligase
MRKLTRLALWLFVFSIPSALMDSFLGVASIPRFLGTVAIALGLLTVVLEGRVRRPPVIVWAGLIFALSSVLSLVWTISYADTIQAAATYVQLAGVLWLVTEFVRTSDERDAITAAFWMGTFVLASDLLLNFDRQSTAERFTATNFNPNYVGLTLSMAFPVAWRHVMTRRGAFRAAASAFCLIAPFALVLTGSRSALLAGVVSFAVVPLTLRRSFVSLVSIAAGFCIVAITIAVLAPQRTLDRVLGTTTEIERGTLGGRGDIWNAGWTVFAERPVLGAGSGAFIPAVAMTQRPGATGHNTPLSLLVEQGVVGLFLFSGLLCACAWTIIRLPPLERKVWALLLIGWLVNSMAHNFHTEKLTWVLFGLLAAERTLKVVRAGLSDGARQHPPRVYPETLRPRLGGV